MTEYDVLGLKYVPVKVKTSDLDALKASYRVIENGSELAGGYSEKNLVSYTGLVANVTENTNGLKTATKNEDGSFSFSARVNHGSESGIKDQALKTAPTAEEAGLKVKEASGSYGEFLRVDLTGNYGDLGSISRLLHGLTMEMTAHIQMQKLLMEQNLQQITGCTKHRESSLD